MARYIKGTGRSQKYKTRAQYKKESVALNKQGGRKTALAELGREDVIYMLAKQPVYIHSREHYYKAGRKTAVNILNKGLSKAVAQAQQKINYLVPMLDTEVQRIVQSLNMSSWEEFQQWWSTEVQPNSVDLQTNNEALYYLALLEKIKKQATSIGTYLSSRSGGSAGKGSGMTAAGVQRLINMGFVNTGFKGTRGEQAGADAAITHIRAAQRQDLTQLAQWLVPRLIIMNDKIADNIITKLKKVVGPNLDGLNGTMNIDQTFATEIGQIQEYISAMYTRELENGIKIKMESVAAEKTGKNSKSYKADTRHIISMGDVQVSFLSSDKTGMETQFGAGSGKAIGYIDKFTAGIKTDTLDITAVESVINFNQIDPNLNDVFQYIIKNGDFFHSRDEESKTIIVAFFAWAKLITELIGAEGSISNMPVVIRMFNRLYRTSDIMRKFSALRGVDIMQYVNKTYLYDFYKQYQNINPIDRQTLREAKRDAMQEMSDKVTYAKLKAAITDTLQTVNGQVMRQGYFSTSFRILLGNVENLKELV